MFFLFEKFVFVTFPESCFVFEFEGEIKQF